MDQTTVELQISGLCSNLVDDQGEVRGFTEGLGDVFDSDYAESPTGNPTDPLLHGIAGDTENFQQTAVGAALDDVNVDSVRGFLTWSSQFNIPVLLGIFSLRNRERLAPALLVVGYIQYTQIK